MKTVIEAAHDRMAKMPNENGWQNRHLAAFQTEPIAHMVASAEAYARAYSTRFPDSSLADDYVLGPFFKDILSGIRALLNGPTGNLDCGTVDAMLVNLAESLGFDQNDI